MHDLTLVGTNVKRCQQIKADGVQCNLPAVGGHSLCHRHRLVHRATARPADFYTPFVHVEDSASLQLAFNDIISRILLGRLDRRDAALIIRSLRALLANMRMEQKAPTDASAIIRDYTQLTENVDWKRHMTAEDRERYHKEDEQSVVELFRPVIERLNAKYAKKKQEENADADHDEQDSADASTATLQPPADCPQQSPEDAAQDDEVDQDDDVYQGDDVDQEQQMVTCRSSDDAGV